jgi:hypothetical protein
LPSRAGDVTSKPFLALSPANRIVIATSRSNSCARAAPISSVVSEPSPLLNVLVARPPKIERCDETRRRGVLRFSASAPCSVNPSPLVRAHWNPAWALEIQRLVDREGVAVLDAGEDVVAVVG